MAGFFFSGPLVLLICKSVATKTCECGSRRVATETTFRETCENPHQTTHLLAFTLKQDTNSVIKERTQ